ncbi:hypothetical protein ACIO14_19300 [Nocardia fluminea]|uniref:hypothetical protein n=1 Tax=Nocardia fluminea TaxID=134984 RepID=UPI00380DAE08
MAYIVLNAGFSTALRSVKMDEEGVDRDAVIDQTADLSDRYRAPGVTSAMHRVCPRSGRR